MTSPASNRPAITFDHASFRVNGRELVHDLELSVNQGETLVLLGRSGSGKTTSLKLINRLLVPSSGEVRVNGKSTTDWDPIRLRRGVGYVIQDGGLFPHFTVARNIALVPQIENWAQEKIGVRVQELLALVDQSGLAERYPQQLSGGQAREWAGMLAADPPICFWMNRSALDPITRSIFKEFGLQ
jgi:osmoprotectant transport system ATP-binding protein